MVVCVSKYNGDLSQSPLLLIISTANTPVHITLLSCLDYRNNHSTDPLVLALSGALAIFHNAARVIQLELKSNRSFNFPSQNPTAVSSLSE